MTCEDNLLLVQASVDGELDAASVLQLEAHLATCPECTAAREALVGLRSRIRGEATRHAMPPGLRQRILRELSAAQDPGSRRASVRAPSRRHLLRGAAMAASLALSAGIGEVAGMRLARPDRDGDSADAVVSAHVRGLQADHLLDVVSTDQHTVKPWFDGKLAFAPPVRDLVEEGFALIGGRLDYVQRRSAAVLVFRRRQHIIDLYVWPTDEPGTTVTRATIDGYNVRSWRQDGFSFQAVSDLGGDELDEFVTRWKAKA